MLGSSRSGGMAHMTRVLRWRDTGFSGRTGWEDQEEELPFMWEKLECMELCLGVDEKPTESLWVKSEEMTALGNITVDVCYRPPDMATSEHADKALYK